MGIQEVKLPDIGEGVTEGELVKWLVKVGDSIKEDQAFAEVMTDKATVEVPSPVAGVVKELRAKEGDTIPIETTMLILETSGEKAAAPQSPTPKKSEATKPIAPAPQASGGVAIEEVSPPPALSQVLATPATRRLAREMNVDINGLSGTGLAGRVTREDVLKTVGGAGAVSAGSPQLKPGLPKTPYVSPTGAPEERVPLRGIRRKIAQQMQQAKHIVPHFTIMDEADVTELVQIREQLKSQGEKYGVKVTYLPFVMKALLMTMREFPEFNASIDDQAEEIVYKKYFHFGFAADTPNGLLVPVVKDVDRKNILEISREILDLATKAREGKIGAEEMKGACISITNIGSVGGSYATPIINHPEVAILGMYKIETKPVWKEGVFVPRQKMNFTATCDHRLIDGAKAARFLKSFIARIENPHQLLLEMV